MPDEINSVSVNGTEYRISYEGLANRPFGVETRETFLPETEVTVAQTKHRSAGTFSTEAESFPVLGDRYVVIFDGDEYETVCVMGEMNPVLSPAGDEGDGEVSRNAEEPPFRIGFEDSGGTCVVYVLVADGETTHKLRIDHADRTRAAMNVMPPLYIGAQRLSLPEALNIIASACDTGFTLSAGPAEGRTSEK